LCGLFFVFESWHVRATTAARSKRVVGAWRGVAATQVGHTSLYKAAGAALVCHIRKTKSLVVTFCFLNGNAWNWLFTYGENKVGIALNCGEPTPH